VEHAAVNVYVRRRKRHQLRDAQAGRVEQLEQRPVAHALGRRRVGRLQQPLHLLLRQKPRELLSSLRARDVGGRVGLDVPVEQKEAVETPHGAQRPSDRPRRQPFARERHDELRHVRLIQQVRLAPRRLRRRLQPHEVAPVALQRVLREPLLHLKETQVFTNQVSCHKSVGRRSQLVARSAGGSVAL
jgi:hypothetical protein